MVNFSDMNVQATGFCLMHTSNFVSQIRSSLKAALSYDFTGQRKSRRNRCSSQVESRLFVEVSTLEARILLAADLGDAPLPYPVTLAENGAQHTTTGPTLGANRDSETNGVHSNSATADDTTGIPDDEDSVTIGVIRAGQLGATVTVNVQNAPSGAKLDAWIDFDQDGSWGGPFEQIAGNLAVVNGNNTVSFDVPSWALGGTTFGRFRLSTTGNLAVTGLAANGEVEDHAISITSPTATIGDFGSQLVIASGNNHRFPNSSQAADFDGDGDMDVVSSFETSDLIEWYENDGTETFTPHTISITADEVKSLYAADLDGDGDVDVVAAGIGAPTNASPFGFVWYENNGSGAFTARRVTGQFDFVQGPLSVFVADMDRDGDMDVLGGQDGGGSQVLWYENDGNQNFVLHLIGEGSGSGPAGYSVVASDVDGDGDMDAVAALGYGGLSWFENNGSQVFTMRIVSPVNTLDDFRSVFAADIDGDGDIDFAAAARDFDTGMAGKFVWYENNGSQSFTLRNLSAAPGANFVFVADMNGDGRADILAASLLDSKIRWFRNDGGGVFTEKLVYSKGDNEPDSTFTAVASDIDSDGDLDVLSSIAVGKVAWYQSLNGLDFGDAPTGYPVTLGEDGARHLVGGPFFGTNRDTESDGTHSAKSDADDLTFVDDEDGIAIDSIRSGFNDSSALIAASATGKVDAWVDFNEDGDWLDPGEKILNSVTVHEGTNRLQFLAPTAQISGSRNARFRISTAGGLAPTGEAADGEVDDLRLFIQPSRAVITGPATPTPFLRPTMTWNAVTGVTQYIVRVTYRSPSPEIENYHVATVTGTSYTPSVDFGIGDYSYTVEAVNPTPDGPLSLQSQPYRFYIKAPVTGLQTAAVQSNVRPTLTWNALPGAVKYDVWIDNLTTNQPQFIRNTNVPANSFTPSADLPFGNYRAWVKGIDASGIYPGAWSIAVDFSIVQLAAPVVTQGQNSTFDRTPTFAWNAVPGAAKYDVVVRNLQNGKTVVEERNIVGTSWTPTTPFADGPYAWWVSAITADGARGVWTDQMDIYIGGRPDLLTPIGSSSDTTPTFSWKPVDGAVRYELWVDRQNPWVQKSVYQTNLTGTSFTSSALSAGTYRIWVRAVSATNEFSPWSVPVDFTITMVAASQNDLLLSQSNDGLLSGVLVSVFDKRESTGTMSNGEPQSKMTDQPADGGTDMQPAQKQRAPEDLPLVFMDESIDAYIVQWMMNPVV